MASPLKFQKVKFEGVNIKLPIVDHLPLSSNLYLEELQFVAFFDRLLHSISEKHSPVSVCLNNNLFERQRQKMNMPTILENFLHVDLASLTAKMSIESVNYINEVCKNKSLVIIPIKLGLLNVLENYNTSFELEEILDYGMKSFNIFNDFDKTHHSMYHSNLLIIDNYNKRIEYFEPHGVVFNHLSAQLINLQNIIYSLVKDLFPFTKEYEFRNAANTCLYGVQNLQSSVDKVAGHCLAWSLYFLMIRLVNYNIEIKTSESISEFLNRFLTTKFTPAQLDTIIKQFISFVSQLPPTTKVYSKHVHIDMTNYIDIIEKIQMEDRCVTLANSYFEKLFSYSFKDIDKLFEELTSYRRLPSFQTIMNEAFNRFLNKQQKNSLTQ
jgi:hypothetical protein